MTHARRTDRILRRPLTATVLAALTGTRRRALLFENVRRFGAGQPLLNVVDNTVGC